MNCFFLFLSSIVLNKKLIFFKEGKWNLSIVHNTVYIILNVFILSKIQYFFFDKRYVFNYYKYRTWAISYFMLVNIAISIYTCSMIYFWRHSYLPIKNFLSSYDACSLKKKHYSIFFICYKKNMCDIISKIKLNQWKISFSLLNKSLNY